MTLLRTALARLARLASVAFRTRTTSLLASVAVCATVAWVGYWGVWEWQVSQLREASRQRLTFFARSLQTILDKYEHLPFMISLQRDAIQLLRSHDPALLEPVNALLRQAQQGTEVAQFYLLDRAGNAVASSEPRLLGNNYGYRPYFRQAMAGQAGILYSVGTTTGLPGCFRSRPVLDGGKIIGAAVIKFSFDALQRAWAESGERLALVDENDIVILSATPEWTYRALKPLSPEALARIGEAKQYPPGSLRPLVDDALDVSPRGSVVDARRFPEGRGRWLAQSYRVGAPGWRLMLFADLNDARQTALIGAACAGFAAAFLISLLVYVQLRRKARLDRLAAQQALREISEDLDRRIAERTGQLSSANRQLHEKIADLERTEVILRQTTDDAVQAGKLAVLGQMAAGVSHELNQPLSALQMLAGNGVTLLDLHETGEVRANLVAMGELAARMGRIVGPLKSFARKSPSCIAPVALQGAIDQALYLLSAVTRKTPAQIEVALEPADLRVQADGVRLEQVLVNLVRNALQAMAGMAQPRLTLTARADADGWVCLSIRDTGPGFSDEALQHLFEPFFTTKPQGEGLGLGLAISRAIVESFGGRLAATNAQPGARFDIFLKDASA